MFIGSIGAIVFAAIMLGAAFEGRFGIGTARSLIVGSSAIIFFGGFSVLAALVPPSVG